jgi:hypothetical protein
VGFVCRHPLGLFGQMRELARSAGDGVDHTEGVAKTPLSDRRIQVGAGQCRVEDIEPGERSPLYRAGLRGQREQTGAGCAVDDTILDRDDFRVLVERLRPHPHEGWLRKRRRSGEAKTGQQKPCNHVHRDWTPRHS